MLAHAGLVTTDVAATLGVVATMWLWWRATRGEARSALARPFALCGLALGVALAAKFSALLLLPMMLACDLLAHGLRDRRRRLLGWLLTLIAAAVVLQLSYLSLAAPLRYLQDARLVYENNPPGYRYYLAGSFAARFPHYFLVAMAVKSTPVELLAMLGGLALAWARRRERWRDDVYLWLPALGWIAAMSALAVPLGVRYVLPAYALLFVLAGALAPALLRMPSWARLAARTAPAMLAVLLLAHAADSLLAFPGYLSYFNGFAGGRGRRRALARRLQPRLGTEPLPAAAVARRARHPARLRAADGPPHAADAGPGRHARAHALDRLAAAAPRRLRHLGAHSGARARGRRAGRRRPTGCAAMPPPTPSTGACTCIGSPDGGRFPSRAGLSRR